MNDGVTFEQFAGSLQREGESALRLVSGKGGPGTIGRRGTSEVTLDLKPGSYAMACFVSAPDGIPRIARGTLKPLQVTPAEAPAHASPTDHGYVYAEGLLV